MAKYVSDAKETVQLLTDGRAADVVVLDYGLPDSNDLTLLARIRRVAPGSQVIMMTASGTPDVRAGALKLGAYCVVSKPFEIRDMTALIRQAYESRYQ